MSHIHVGVIHGAIIFATVLVFGFFWRLASALLSDNAFGQGMSFIY